MRVYCDTDTLFHNIAKHLNQPAVQAEMDALQLLLAKRASGGITLLRSLVTLREVGRTKDSIQLHALMTDYQTLEPVPLDERHYGNTEEMVDLHGSFVSSPLVSDVQDEKMLAELQGFGLRRKDAEHLTQAICNKCSVFLTRDADIIKRRGRIQAQFPIKVLRPSEV